MEDLLSAGSIQSGRFAITPRPAQLSDLLRDALETVESLVDQRGQQVEQSGPFDQLRVRVDPRYARQVLSNLLANASKYSPDHSTIRVVSAVQHIGSRWLCASLRCFVRQPGPVVCTTSGSTDLRRGTWRSERCNLKLLLE